MSRFIALRGRNFHGNGGIGVIAVLFRGEIKLEQVAGAQDAVAGDAVDHFVVHADGNVAGKTIDDGRRRARAVLGEHF